MENLTSIVVVGLLIVLFVGWLTTLLVEHSSLHHTRLASYLVAGSVLLTIAGLTALLFIL